MQAVLRLFDWPHFFYSVAAELTAGLETRIVERVLMQKPRVLVRTLSHGAGDGWPCMECVQLH